MKEIMDFSPNTDLVLSESFLNEGLVRNLFTLNAKHETAKEIISELETDPAFSVPPKKSETSAHAQIDGVDLLKTLSVILQTKNFHTEYEPILSLDTGKIFGYEALARFYIEGQRISPEFVFQELHKDADLFFEFETNLKRFQIENRPKGKNLFLNLDPHVCKNETQANSWNELLGKKKNIVCEIIENTDSTWIEETRFCLNALKNSNVPIALDDMGGKRNLFCFDFLEYSKFIKFDKHWLHLFKTKESYKNIAWGFLDFARESNIQCILEGIETQEDLLIAAEMRFPLVQGFLFRSKNILV
ncbi:EAL domain-containing protein [Leptospira kmetyi]|uniref:EAL domain-containing protein n=1 Tax=Leptospira kmetyi TaxID=408139 RepID=A0ABX4N7J8_9LEPT|nr:EAL domain-containing protein [Leptospira kmetyi]EQA55137.1 cyclic diguanylate phosphodiesterase (EAL) domain protein [Leptospira kmetyi serovar Malaysia str. Bejo-Iso9]PJZ28124.1 EAL domain-containing protein [Leptospira kmetyi]PJZ39937.1 EAL domain-containing protein [Leptospira kmetyi]